MPALLPSAAQAQCLSWEQLQKQAASGALALLPLGATEAHGPHLPLGTDVFIAQEVCRRIAERLLNKQQAALVFPAFAYGVTEFARHFPGTVGVSPGTLGPFLTETLVAIAAHGFRRIGILNHHLEPDQFRVVKASAQAAAAQTGACIVVPDHRARGFRERLGAEFCEGGSHAGQYETSLVLAFAPELVDENLCALLPDLAVNLPEAIRNGARDFESLGATRAYLGSPRNATAEEGHRLLDLLAAFGEAALLADRGE